MPLPSMLGIAAQMRQQQNSVPPFVHVPVPLVRPVGTRQAGPSQQATPTLPTRAHNRLRSANVNKTEDQQPGGSSDDACSSQKRRAANSQTNKPNTSAELPAKRQQHSQPNHTSLYLDRDKPGAAQFQLHNQDGSSSGNLTEAAISNLLVELSLAAGDREQENRTCEHYNIQHSTGLAIFKRWRQHAGVGASLRSSQPVKQERLWSEAAASGALVPVDGTQLVGGPACNLPSREADNYIRLYVDHENAGAPQFRLRHKDIYGKRGELTVGARLNLLVELSGVRGDRGQEHAVCKHYAVHRNTGREIVKRWRERASVTTAPRSGRPFGSVKRLDTADKGATSSSVN